MNTKNEPCSICERYMNGVICEEKECPVAMMKTEIESLNEQQRILICQLAEERDKAIKEFAGRLKVESFLPLGSWISERIVTEKIIDNLVEEMTGDE